MNHNAVVAGHVSLDITPRFPRYLKSNLWDIFRPGRLINVEDAVVSLGGPVSNTGIALIKMGKTGF